MPIRIVVGSQWGDEGKGKIIDILAKQSNLVIRAQGGNNAGHTVKLNNDTYNLKLIPSGILYENVKCLISSGTVINPPKLIEEMQQLQKKNISLKNLLIDPNAHVIMPWHILLDKTLDTTTKIPLKIGTTKNGIGPCYADKAYRLGIKLIDLIHENNLKNKINTIGVIKNNLLNQVFQQKKFNLNEIFNSYLKFGQILKPFFINSVEIITNAINSNANILFEGAQGTLLDSTFGTYPFVTSSSTIASGICAGAPIGPTKIDSTIGVSKAYLTRVGEGPMPTEINDEISSIIRHRGNEFGTNTHRPRRIGWLDCVMLKYAVQVNGLNEIIMNKLDVLKNVKKLKICYAYKNQKGELINQFPINIETFNTLTPVYKELPGFNENISNCTKFEHLPLNCQLYIKEVENICKCKITMIGVGPNRDQNIIIN